MKISSLFTFAVGLSIASSIAHAGFVSYAIRGTPVISPSGSNTEFVIDHSGDKGAFGSNDVNGSTIGDLLSLSITRYDDIQRFAGGSGAYVAPYFNIWITDGAGHYAVVANEPSNPDFYSLFQKDFANDIYTYNLSYAAIADKAAKIFENSDKSWLPNNGVGLKFSDLAGYRIEAPTASLIATGWSGLGTGAPRESGTNTAYGVNWVFGDTLSNYVSGQQGYIVGNASVRAANASVPDTSSSMLLLGLGLLGLMVGRRTFRNRA